MGIGAVVDARQVMDKVNIVVDKLKFVGTNKAFVVQSIASARTTGWELVQSLMSKVDFMKGITIMNSFYSEKELRELGLHSFGRNVKISRKSSIYGAANISIGDNVRVDDFCILSGHIEIGNYIHIAAYTVLYGGAKGIYISDFANLSSRISIYSVSDDYSGETMTNPMVPDEYKNVVSKSVYIGKHAIIGSTSVVLPGVKIAEGSSFGSFSFINRDSEPWSINVGIPFKKIKNRSKELLKLEKQFMLEN